MSSYSSRLSRLYAAGLKKFLAGEEEAVLAKGYELGRQAIARGLGVLDVARLHQQALETAVRPVAPPGNWTRRVRTAGTFFLESLSPFEVTHRGFRETNVHLQRLNATLEKRNLDLAVINRQLQREIRAHERAERALRESEQRLRRMFNEARRMEESLRDLSNQVVHAQEEERKRVSRELHDEVGQALVAVSVTLGALKRECATHGADLERKLAEAQRLLQTTMNAVHDFARELRPAMLDELGLLPALRSYLNHFAQRAGLTVLWRASAAAEALNSDQKTVLFRVAQESLTNVAKHARASRVTVTLRKAGDTLCLEVADNGRSFRAAPNAASGSKKRLGLLGMEERVRLVNGRLAIRPCPGKGTTVRVWLPFSPNGAPKPPEILPRRRSARPSSLSARTTESARKS